MKRWARIASGLFFVGFGLSLIVGQTFPFQGYALGALAIAAGILITVDK